MNIGIIGTGNMGRTLGLVWAELGHAVFFGSRDPDPARAAAVSAAQLTGDPAAGERHGPTAEAARFGDLLLYTARGVALENALGGAEAVRLLAGKVVVDLNNQEVPEDFVFPPVTRSLAETLAGQAPGARVVKAFNTIGMETFELCPEAIRPFRVSVFVAGDDADARRTILDLAAEMGFAPVDCGPLVHARLLEGAADLIRFLMIGQKMADANFSLARVPDAAHPRLGGRQESALK